MEKKSSFFGATSENVIFYIQKYFLHSIDLIKETASKKMSQDVNELLTYL